MAKWIISRVFFLSFFSEKLIFGRSRSIPPKILTTFFCFYFAFAAIIEPDTNDR